MALGVDVIHFFSKLWRIPATGFGFLCFFTGGILFRLIVFPALNHLISDDRQRELTARRVVSISFYAFIRMLCGLQVLKLEVDSQLKKRLAEEPLFICASHPTLIDVVILHGLINNANCIVKAALKQSFALSSPIKAAGYIANDSGPELIQACAESLARNDTLVVFPEGTRSVPNQSPKLHHGAAAIALASQRNITPIRITCTPPALMKGVAWYQVPERKMTISVQALEDIDVLPFMELERQAGRPVAVRRLTSELKKRLFEQATQVV